MSWERETSSTALATATALLVLTLTWYTLVSIATFFASQKLLHFQTTISRFNPYNPKSNSSLHRQSEIPQLYIISLKNYAKKSF